MGHKPTNLPHNTSNRVQNPHLLFHKPVKGVFLCNYSRKNVYVKPFFGWQWRKWGYNVTYSATICTKGTEPLPTRTWVPINEEIWLPIRSLGLKSCDMGRLYWSQASILSYLSGWSRFRFFLCRNRQGDYMSIQFGSKIMVFTFFFIAEDIKWI